MRKLFILLIAVFAISCNQHADDPNNLPIARVHDNYLYTNDLEELIPQNLTQIDSLALVNDYIEKWVKQQLILAQAEANLTNEEKNVEKQINDYRTSLLVFKYEQNLIQQKLDTVITQEEIDSYYENNLSNFILAEHLIKGLYIKLPINTSDIWKVRRWYRSDKEEDVKKLEAFCYQYAEEVDYFDTDWIIYNALTAKLPKLYSSASNNFQKGYIEVKDDEFHYFVRISDYKLEGKTAPVEYVQDKIKSIILNKRKINYINHLEADIYNDALNRGNFNIY